MHLCIQISEISWTNCIMYTHAPIRPCMCIFAISIYAHAHVHEPPMTCHMPPYNASRKTQGVFLFFLFKKSFYFVYCMWHCHSPGSMLATPFGRTPPHPPFGNCCLPTFPHCLLFLLLHGCFMNESWPVTFSL